MRIIHIAIFHLALLGLAGGALYVGMHAVIRKLPEYNWHIGGNRTPDLVAIARFINERCPGANATVVRSPFGL